MANLPSFSDMEMACIFFGVFLSLFLFTATKAVRQTWSIWKRTKTLWNWYIWMMWIELVTNLVFALTTYLFLRGTFAGSLKYYIGVVIMWTILTQLLLQIIANRVGLIMVDKQKSRIIKWTLFIGIACVNISVFCIWIPALMNTNPTWVHLNHAWERVEKSIFLIVDLGLNLYFLYLVRSKLIAKGLTKYWPLFNFNAAVVLVSTSMDILLLGLQNLPNTYDYIQFAPIAYTVKLNIELTMAELISKVVRSTHRVDFGDSVNLSDGTTHTSNTEVMQQPHCYFPTLVGKSTDFCVEKGDVRLGTFQCEPYQGEGIMKTVTMQRKEDDEAIECCSSATSTVKDSSVP